LCSIALGVKRIRELSDQREEQSCPVQKDRLVEKSLEHPFPHNSEHPEYIDNDHLLEWLQEWTVPRFRLPFDIERLW
jgi:hypothetical protein